MWKGLSSGIRPEDCGPDPQYSAPPRVFSFDFEPVLKRAGSCLAENPERLRLALESRIAKAAPYSYAEFIENGFYLMVPPGLAEQASDIAARVNVEVLKILFGTEHLTPGQIVQLYRVAGETRRGPNGDVIWVDPNRSEAAPESRGNLSPESEARVLAFKASKLPEARPQREIDLRFIPVYDLRRNAVSTFFCSPVTSLGDSCMIFGYGAFQRLGPREYPVVDAAILQYASIFAERLKDNGILAAVGSSVNFETLAWAKGRQMFQEALQRCDAIGNPYFMLKIEQVPVGVPESRLVEIVSSVRAYVKRVFVHLPEGDDRFAGGGLSGVAGFVASLPARQTRPAVAAIANSMKRLCDAQRAFACIDCIEKEESLDLVRAVGIRFGAGKALGTKLFRWDDSVEDIRELVRDVADVVPTGLPSAAQKSLAAAAR